MGGERVLLRLLSALDRRRTEPIVVLAEDGPLREQIEALAIPTHLVSLRWWIPATHWSRDEFLAQLEGLGERTATVAAWLRKEAIDLVHTNTIVTAEGALASARAGIPHVWHSRGLFNAGFPPAYYGDTRFIFSVVDQLADRILCVARTVKAQMEEVCRHELLEVIYDGFDAETFLRNPVEPAPAFRAHLGIPDGVPLVATVGGIQKRKGLEDLVDAATLLRRSGTEAVFLLVGAESDAAFAAALRTKISAANLGAVFRFLGFRPNVRNVLAQVDLLVHPSFSEGFGFAVLEAMAAELPVVATRCGGPEEIVQDGETGLLVEVGRPDALAAAIGELLSSPERSRQMGRKGRRRLDDFSLSTTAVQTENVYDAVAAEAAGRTAEETARKGALADRLLEEILVRAHSG
jgi:glycosyltransferase involved in cell wall biosynthesis